MKITGYWFGILVTGQFFCSSPASAQEVDRLMASDDAVEAIIVEARKIDEVLLEVPLSVSVVTGDELTRSGTTEMRELVRLVPGLDLTPVSTTRATGPKIRGISTFSFSDGLESSVATILDGVVLGREAQGFFDFFDIEAIEVIRGPQGTVFGKNSSAGAINVRTRDPESQLSGYGSITYGSFDEWRAEGAITGPISNDVAVRLAGISNRRKGTIRNGIAGEPDLNDKSRWGLRGKALLEPSSRLSVLISADISDESSHCCAPTFRSATPATPAIDLALNPDARQLGEALEELDIVAGPANRSAAIRYESVRQDSRAFGLNLSLAYELGAATLTSITGWREWNGFDKLEVDGVSNSAINDLAETSTEAKQFSQEIRVAGSAGTTLAYVVGLYHFQQMIEGLERGDIQIALPFSPFFNVRTMAQRKVKNESTAVFAEGTLNLTPTTSLIAGMRYSIETAQSDFERTSEPIIEALPSAPVFGPEFSGLQSTSDEAFSGRIIARHFLSPNVMTYLSWSRGFKGTGIDVALTADLAEVRTPGGLPTLQPEIPTLWEFGLKAELNDSSAISLAVFDQSVRNLQTISNDAAGRLTNLSVDRIDARGFEIEGSLAPKVISGLSFVGSLAYLDIAIEAFTGRRDLEGLPFRDNPSWTYSLGGEYRGGTKGGIRPIFSAEMLGQSSKNSSFELEEYTGIPGYTLVHFRAGIEDVTENWRLVLAVENAFEVDYANFVFGSPYRLLDGGSSSQFLGDPRTISLTLSARR